MDKPNDTIYYRMIYKEKNVFSFWYESQDEAQDKGLMDIYYNVPAMRWYERDKCLLEKKIIKTNEIIENIENIENMYKNKNKFFNNNENWAYIYKK
jgi:hypothetical protein